MSSKSTRNAKPTTIVPGLRLNPLRQAIRWVLAQAQYRARQQ